MPKRISLALSEAKAAKLAGHEIRAVWAAEKQRHRRDAQQTLALVSSPRPKRRKRHIAHAPLLYRIAKIQGFKCILCGGGMLFGAHPNDPHRASVDHVIPRSLGGRDHNNRLAAHKGCNTDKASSPPTGCELIWLQFVNAELDAAFAPAQRTEARSGKTAQRA